VRELDTLLTRFLDTRYPDLPADMQADFARLLECQDPDLLDWLMGRRDDFPDPGIAVLVGLLREINGTP